MPSIGTHRCLQTSPVVVQVIHPGCGCIAGHEGVMESWRSILAGVRPRAFRIDLEDVRVFATDNSGFVTCVEIVDADDSAGRCGGRKCECAGEVSQEFRVS